MGEQLSGVIRKCMSQLLAGYQSRSCCNGCIQVSEMADEEGGESVGGSKLRWGCSAVTRDIKVMNTTLGMGGKKKN